MTANLTKLAELQNFENYKAYSKERLKQLSDALAPIWVSKDKIDFDDGGKVWKGNAVFVGTKSDPAVKALKKDGIVFLEGNCRAEGKELFVDGLGAGVAVLDASAVKAAETTLKRLKMGWSIVGAEAEDDAPSTATKSPALLQKRLASLEDEVRRFKGVGTKETEPFMEKAAERAKEAAKLITSKPERATELLAEGEEFARQAVVGMLEGGDPTEAVQVETRRQDLAGEVASVKALGDTANDDIVKQSTKALEAVIVAVGRKDVTKANQLLDAVESLLGQVVEGPEPAANADPDIAGFADWAAYRTFMKVQLKRVAVEGSPIFITREKFEFSIAGKPFKSNALLVGPKARATAALMKREGTQFMEGVVKSSGKSLLVTGVKEGLFRGASRTMVKLRLGRKLVADGELVADAEQTAEDVAADPTGTKAIDKEIKEIAESLVKLRDALETQKKGATTLAADAEKKRKAADAARKAARDAATAGKDDPALWDTSAAADLAYENSKVAAKEAGVSATRAAEALRASTERLQRVKTSTEPVPARKAELKKLKAEVAAQLLDAKMANLDPADPKTGVILAKQIEARFGVKLKLYESKVVLDKNGKPTNKDNAKKADPKKEAEALKDLYLTLAKAPAFPSSHLKKIEVSLRPDGARGEGGVYYGDSNKVEITCKRPKESLNYGNQLGINKFFPDGVDADAQPKNMEPVSYFSWATLHEVAHAVDAKHKFMDTKGKDSKYGGWTEYGGNYAPVAKAVAAHFGTALSGPDKTKLEQYTNTLMGNGKKAPTTPEETNVKNWVDAVREDKGLWWNGGNSKSLAIGTKVYQEAYGNWWVSYDLAARSKGIHGYQFRAPGEWFAELYAAYYSDKLKPSHPFVPDLAKLETPK